MSALQYALLAKKSYQVPPTIGDPDSASRALVEGNTVIFRGSDDAAAWFHDLDAVTTKTPLGEMHEGFWLAFMDIQPQLMALAPEVVCGHSLGAALALIYAGALCQAGKPPKAVYAFEPPRPSVDSVLTDALSGVDLLLFRNGQDIVPDFPRSEFLIWSDGWRFPGALIKIGTPSYPFPNFKDHLIENVIASLSTMEL